MGKAGPADYQSHHGISTTNRSSSKEGDSKNSVSKNKNKYPKPSWQSDKRQSTTKNVGLSCCILFLGILAAIVATVGFIGTDEARSAKLTELLRTYTDDPKFRAAVERVDELRRRSLLIGGVGGEDVLRPGEQLYRKGRRAQYPVVLIPGVTSSTLELWQGRECARKGFRDIYWGGGHMVSLAFRNHTCWMQHLMLDTETWEDPPGVKMRAGSGYSATDYLFPGYWVWGKLIQNLADVSYDPSNMIMMSYDWRLTPQMLEKRDGYFTALKGNIEFLVKRNGGKRVALVSHSMGSLWLHFFFNMMERLEAGWTERYVKKYINIAGPLLGVPKALGAAISGEMKDIADIGQLGQTIMAQFFSNDDIIRCFRSIGSVPSMLPCGGSAVWASADSRDMITFNPPATVVEQEPDQCGLNQYIPDNSTTTNRKCRARNAEGQHKRLTPGKDFIGGNRSADEAILFLEKVAPEYMKLVSQYYAIEEGSWQGDVSDNRTWMYPYLSPLPPGGHLEITCMYGLINDSFSTEIGYHYNFKYPLRIDFEAAAPEHGLKSGVWLGQGDGSVPLQSLGYICAGPWRKKDKGFNPSGHQVKIREYRHEPAALWEAGGDIRGGEYAASHVEILGNKEIIRDVLTLVTEPVDGDAPDSEFALDDRVYSNLWEMVADIDKRRGKEHR